MSDIDTMADDDYNPVNQDFDLCLIFPRIKDIAQRFAEGNMPPEEFSVYASRYDELLGRIGSYLDEIRSVKPSSDDYIQYCSIAQQKDDQGSFWKIPSSFEGSDLKATVDKLNGLIGVPRSDPGLSDERIRVEQLTNYVDYIWKTDFLSNDALIARMLDENSFELRDIFRANTVPFIFDTNRDAIIDSVIDSFNEFADNMKYACKPYYAFIRVLAIYDFITRIVVSKRIWEYFISLLGKDDLEDEDFSNDEMVQVFMSREDYENFDLPSRSTESFFSLEAVPGEPAEPGDNTTGEGDPEKMKKLEAMQKKDEEGFARKLADANLQQKKFKHKVKVLWSRVTGKSGFYKKYMGRIDGLFKQFGTEAKLNENQMRGDPVQILQNDAFEFMKQLIVGLEKLHNDTVMIAKKSSSSLTAEGQLKAVEAFIGKPISDPVVQKDMGKAFFRAFIKRIGLLLFKDNPVYGYTVDSVVENMKLPPANHVIVSLFVPNPESQPQERSVSDIFATPDSFKIMGDINKVPIYNIAGLSAEAIAKLGQLTDIKLLADAKKNAIKNMREDQNGPKDDLTRQYIRMANSLWKGIERSVDYFVKLKNYITWCCDVYANMVDRIDKLCRHAIVAMLYLENNSKDSRYNTGHGNASKIMISRNAQATDKKGSAQNWTHGKDHTTTGSIHKALNTSTHLKKVGIQTQDQHDRNVTGTKYNKKTNRFETT